MGGGKETKTALETQRIQAVNLIPQQLQSRKGASRMSACSPHIACLKHVTGYS